MEQTTTQPPLTEEQKFRLSLEDAVDIVEHLAKFCATPEEVAGMMRLALKNDGQLRLFMALMGGESTR